MALVALALGACGSDETLGATAVEAPRGFEVQAVGTNAVRLAWDHVSGSNVAGYEVRRRTNLEGAFVAIASNIPQGAARIVFFDNAVAPDTWYGYEVVALSALGTRSAPSTVGGTRTPPPPTLVVSAITTAANDASVDPDGYVASLLGARDTLTAPMGTNGERRFSNLKAGVYTVVLRGLARNCDFASGDSLRSAHVVDVGTQTESRVSYSVSCRDPKKGSLVIRYEQDGDTTDANGVRLSITGLLTPDPTDTARVYARTETIAGRIATNRYDNLRAGSYEVVLDDLAGVCSLQGERKRTVAVKALSLDTLRYSTRCTRPVVVDTAGKPLLLSHAWSQASGGVGSKVALEMSLDTRAMPGVKFAGAQAEVGYDPTVLRYDSARASDFPVMTVNGRNAGLVIFGALDTDNVGVSGQVRIGRLWFTVVGATGSSTRTSSTVRSLPTLASPPEEFAAKARVSEAVFTVGQFNTQNQPPVARANGPYSGTSGVALQLTAIGSADPDGTIASYRWDFGDGTAAGSGAQVQHTWLTPGSYTATLTVTDDKGATGTEAATVTITNSGASNQPPVARISAPSTATPGSSVTFSGTSSSDADGAIASWAWTFGDGSTGSGATATHVYAGPGTYTVSLTVTDNRSATSSATHVITVAPANSGTTPFTWTGSFGAVDPATKFVDLVLTLDLTANIAETPGAEALGSYIVDSLRWDPAVLKLEAFNFGPGQQQAIDQSDVPRGKVKFSGNTLPTQDSGVLTIARLRFRVVGAKGATVTTQTAVGPLIGSTATGSYNYRPKVDVREATLVVP